MSHAVHIPMNGIRDLALLEEALRQMGEKVETGRGLVAHADDADMPVDLLCGRKGEYAIGFYRKGGRYHIFADWYWIGRNQHEFAAELAREYQLATVLRELSREGLVEVVKIERSESGILLEVRENEDAPVLRGDMAGQKGRRGARATIDPSGALAVDLYGYRGGSCEEATRGLESVAGPAGERSYHPERWEADDDAGIGTGAADA